MFNYNNIKDLVSKEIFICVTVTVAFLSAKLYNNYLDK